MTMIQSLTHWGRVTHICISKLTIIGSDNGLSPERRHAIIWTNAGLLLIGPIGTNFSEILIEIPAFSFKEMHLNCVMAVILSRPQCVKQWGWEVGDPLASLLCTASFLWVMTLLCDAGGKMWAGGVYFFLHVEERQDIDISLGTNHQCEIFCLICDKCVYQEFVYMWSCVLGQNVLLTQKYYGKNMYDHKIKRCLQTGWNRFQLSDQKQKEFCRLDFDIIFYIQILYAFDNDILMIW